MRAMDVGVEAAASPQCMVPLQARLELVNAIGQLNVCSAVFTCNKKWNEACIVNHAASEHCDTRLVMAFTAPFLLFPPDSAGQVCLLYMKARARFISQGKSVTPVLTFSSSPLHVQRKL